MKKLGTSPYHPETNGQCEHAKKNLQEWVATLTHAYNCTVLPVTGFSPYFLMFRRTPKLPLDVELGVPLVEQKQTSHQNYAQKLHSKLQ